MNRLPRNLAKMVAKARAEELKERGYTKRVVDSELASLRLAEEQRINDNETFLGTFPTDELNAALAAEKWNSDVLLFFYKVAVTWVRLIYAPFPRSIPNALPHVSIATSAKFKKKTNAIVDQLMKCSPLTREQARDVWSIVQIIKSHDKPSEKTSQLSELNKHQARQSRSGKNRLDPSHKISEIFEIESISGRNWSSVFRMLFNQFAEFAIKIQMPYFEEGEKDLRRCKECGNFLDPSRRKDAVFCGDECRNDFHNSSRLRKNADND